MVVMKRVTLGLIFLSLTAVAQERTIVDSFIETLPDAIVDAVTIDLPTDVIIGGLSGDPFTGVMIGTGTAILGYAVRKTCNHWKSNETAPVWCGLVGGPAKYIAKKKLIGRFNWVEPFIGGADAGTYEGLSTVNFVPLTAKIMAIETAIGALAYQLRPVDPTTPETSWAKELFKSGTAGAVVSLCIYTIHEWYGKTLKEAIKAWPAWSDGFAQALAEQGSAGDL
jgi:hypothetical protein